MTGDAIIWNLNPSKKYPHTTGTIFSWILNLIWCKTCFFTVIESRNILLWYGYLRKTFSACTRLFFDYSCKVFPAWIISNFCVNHILYWASTEREKSNITHLTFFISKKINPLEQAVSSCLVFSRGYQIKNPTTIKFLLSYVTVLPILGSFNEN